MTRRNILRGSFYTIVIAAAALALLVLPSIFDGMYIPGDAMLLLAGAALIFGAIGYALILFARHLAGKIGNATAVAALVGAAAIVGTALALALPSCPGGAEGVRCTTPEGAGWGFSLAMLIAISGAVYLLGSVGVRNFRILGGKVKESLRESREEKQRERFNQQVEEGRKAAKTRDPQAKKGYPTPKRETRKKRKNKT